MKIVSVDELKGGEVLASPILTEECRILIGKGTVIKTSYIGAIRELNIKEVTIKDENALEEESKIIKKEVKKDCLTKVKDILERHTYNNNANLMAINDAAEEVIESVLENEKVTEKVFEIKERSADLYEHSVSVCSLAILTTLKLELSKEQIYEIGVASLLHDLGLRYVTVNYENQDINELNQKDLEEFRKHTVYGYTAVQQEQWISEKAKQMILFHHERIDGNGYPLHAKDISIESQILGVCEFLDEQLCGIGCVRTKVHEAIQYLQALKGTVYAEKIVESILTFMAVYPVGTTVKLSDNSVGIVLKQSEHFTDRPILQILIDKEGNPCEEKTLLDLTKIHNVVIDSVLD